jgi:predicted ATPase
MLGYPDVALADTEDALQSAREIGHIPTLMYALLHASITHLYCGNYITTCAEADELTALADNVGSSLWKAEGVMFAGWVLSLTGKAAKAAEVIFSAIRALEFVGATLWAPSHLSHLGLAYAQVRQFDHARGSIRDALKTMAITKEVWCEAEVHRLAGEIELMATERDAVKAQAYFERALEIARAQQARSWELRAATSLARLWRDQGRRAKAHDRLAPVYGWFTEGFDTLDLKEARALLKELAS